MAIQYAIQQAILYVGDTINTHKILHSRILRSTHLEHAIDGSLAGSHGAEYCARIKSAYCTVEIPTVASLDMTNIVLTATSVEDKPAQAVPP